MLTVTQLARKAGISRATVLYYERAGLLHPACRSDNGYRWYGERETQRLESILAYRSFGIPVAELPSLLDRGEQGSRDAVLRAQFDALETEIQRLRRQQQAIVNFLEHPDLLEENMVTKERWTEIMRAAGLSDDDMHNWHRQFEKMEPEAHQEFLESLSIDAEEIRQIRNWSRD